MVKMVDMVDKMARRRIKMGEFLFHVDEDRMLPIDQSLSGFLPQVQDVVMRDPPKGKPSRRLMEGAFCAIPCLKDSKEGQRKARKDTLYEMLRYDRLDMTEKNNERTTQAVVIKWEVQKLLLALCEARGSQRTLKGGSLAKAAIEMLIEEMRRKNLDDVKTCYWDRKLLNAEQVKAIVASQYNLEIEKRLWAVWNLTVRRPATEVLEAMKLVYPALDNLVLALAQVEQSGTRYSAEEAKTQDQLALELFWNYYNDLVRGRPELEQRGWDEAMPFRLSGQEKLLSELKASLEGPGEDPAETARLYEQFLIEKDREVNPDANSAVDGFLDNCKQLDGYVNKIEAWNEVQPQVWEELCTYIKNIFNDIRSLNYIPYDYSEYEEAGARAAFIKECCKNVHNQIHCHLHQVFRLLLENAYRQDILSNLPEESRYFGHVVLVGWTSKWVKQVKAELERLRHDYKQFPFLFRDDDKELEAMVNLYNGEVAEKGVADLITVETMKEHMKNINHASSLVLWCEAWAEILRIIAQIIAVHIARSAQEEIREQYNLLASIYNKNK